MESDYVIIMLMAILLVILLLFNKSLTNKRNEK